MQNVRINYLIVGLFVLVSLVGIVVVAAILTGRTGGTDRYTTVFDNVTGIKFGSQVLFEGFPVGQVDEILPEPRGDGRTVFRVVMAIQEDWPVPADSTVVITATGMLSAVLLEIRAGQSDTLASPGAELAAVNSLNMFAAMAEVSGQISDLSTNGLMPLLESLNGVVEPISAAASQDVPAILSEVRILSESLNTDVPAAMAALRRLSERLETDIVTEERLDNLDEILADVSTFSNSMASIGGSLEGTAQDLNTLLGQVDRLVQSNSGEVDASIADLRYTLGALARSIDGITHNLDGTARNMAEFSRAIRQNPGLLLRGGPPEDEALRGERR